MSTPLAAGFRQPAEWAPHEAVWLAWPSHEDLWQGALRDAQREFVEMCRAIADVVQGRPRGEALHVLVRDDEGLAQASTALAGLGARFVRAAYGDIWLRDTGPIFLLDGEGRLGSARFLFDGWGGKYRLEGDADLAAEIQRACGAHASFALPFVLEGGAVEVDGEGTLLTSRQCLLRGQRNAGMDQQAVERALREALGVETILWLEEGLRNDHTDGHVDTLARFVAPGLVVCMAPSGDDDPNAAVLERIAADLARMRDARGRRLEVVRIPSPGRVLDEQGEVLPASHVNFYIGNTTVVVPTYGTRWDEAAVAALAPLFPGRRVLGRSARAILTGGGAFHCITQQQPATRTSAR